MRSFVKVALLSPLALLIACGSSDGGAPAPSAGSEQPAAPVVTAANDSAQKPAGDREGDINRLVAAAGVLTTDKKADPQPVQTGASTTQDTTGANGTAMMCTYTPYSLTKVPEKFVALNPNADVLWPGSLVQGRSMAGGILDPIPVKRAPGTITLTLASGGGGPFFKKMEEPSLSAAIQAQNEILAAYTGGTPAKFSYSYESIYSSEQLAVAVDANVEGTNWSAAASLSVDKKDAKSRFLIQFTQEFFTMAFDPPQGAAGVFAPSVTADDLKPYAQPGNPPVYVSSVTYGRIFYILFESNESQLSLETAVKGSYSGGVSATANAAAAWRTTINNSTVKAYGLGGNADAAIAAAIGTGDKFTGIAKFLTDSATFSASNPGVPISYTIRNLTDSSQVKLALTTEYTAKNCVPSAVGCDGVKGSGKTVDACGVCGGTATTCNCPATTLQFWAGNGAYVNFNLAETATGQNVTFPDGNYYAYKSAYCHNIIWGNMVAACRQGRWSWASSSVRENIECDPDTNASWSDGSGNSISTGYAAH
jgi:thiol-activated cytolysin